MKNKLMMLLNTLAQIETKGDGTIKMALCIQHIQQMIVECDDASKPSNPPSNPEEHKCDAASKPLNPEEHKEV